MIIDKILTQKKPDSVAAAIRDAILSGSISGGEELTQNELAESLGVSRMPVREALLTLEYQGLVERLPNNHVRVVTVDAAFLAEVFRSCLAVEQQLLGKPLSPREVSSLRSVLSGGSADAELYFHRFLCRRAENALLRKQLETMTEVYVAFAVLRPGHSAAEACGLLNEAVSGSEDALERYFMALT